MAGQPVRFLLRIEYDGAPFCGWQRQANGLSVQEALEAAAARFDGGPVAIVGAGRTDAGVHALGQAAHADFRREMAPERLCEALNALVRPHPVAVITTRRVASAFHARFDASARHYLYRIANRRAPAALDRGRVWHRRRRLDVEAMQRAARHLIGRHDFTSFRDVRCQADNPVRTLDRLSVERVEDEVHVVGIARSFLHRQMRSMVGSLVEIGSGRWPPERMAAILAAADRSACGPVAPAHGLFLTQVDYDDSLGGEEK